MKREDTLKLARAAGAIHIHERPKEFALFGNDALERFAELVAAAAKAEEKEACAKECQDRAKDAPPAHAAEAWLCAAAIRARGNT